MKKVFAINGSPHLEKGNTAMLLSVFLDGIRSAGATVELFYANRLNIKACIGDFPCWNVKPGECIHRDDMDDLYPKLRGSDILILATPVYIPLPGAFVNFLNRLLPLFDPFLETRAGRTRARFNSDVRIRQIVLVATCGWWEMGNFGTIERIVREFAEDVSVEYAGALLRPHAHLIQKAGEVTASGKLVLEAANCAGRELIKSGEISAQTLEKVGQPLITQEEARRRSNEHYHKVRAKE